MQTVHQPFHKLRNVRSDGGTATQQVLEAIDHGLALLAVLIVSTKSTVLLGRLLFQC